MSTKLVKRLQSSEVAEAARFINMIDNSEKSLQVIDPEVMDMKPLEVYEYILKSLNSLAKGLFLQNQFYYDLVKEYNLKNVTEFSISEEKFYVKGDFDD